MKNYKVVGRRRIGSENGKETYRVVILADTEADVPEKNYDENEPNKIWAPMSVCYIAETGDCKVLNTHGVWCDA